MEVMRLQRQARSKTVLALIALALVVVGQFLWAQNLGSAPASNVAVQGQTGAQPEGAFLNFINWIGNVIAPVGAGGAVLGAVVSWLTGRGFGRWLFAAAALLAISGVTRLIEFWITNGTSGVT
jgi:phosphatidylglycerophosphate synthase